jgi:hypothetical protein
MSEFLGADVWARIQRESNAGTRRTAAVAYLTDAVPIAFSRGDLVIVDASDASIGGGRTSVQALRQLLARGVRLYSVPNLHAKVFVFDSSVVVGSTNLSVASQQTLVEAAILSRDPAAIRDATDFVESLTRVGVRIDSQFLSRAADIPVSISTPEPDIQGQSATGRLWYLAVSPNALSKNMRAYFLALITAQLGALEAERLFRLWPGADFRQHEKEGRLRRQGVSFVLTHRGVEYFSQPKQQPKGDLLHLFLAAVRTGDGTLLPDNMETKMLPMPEA